jgi:hypothetical protein
VIYSIESAELPFADRVDGAASKAKEFLADLEIIA